MSPLFDRKCVSCETVLEDCYEPSTAPEVRCTCGALTERVWRAAAVIPDDIPGGIFVKNGICWPDGSPRRYDSKSAMKKEADRLGLVNRVQHCPPEGSDRSKWTTRWT